jgi:hypothetical protein
LAVAREVGDEWAFVKASHEMPTICLQKYWFAGGIAASRGTGKTSVHQCPRTYVNNQSPIKRQAASWHQIGPVPALVFLVMDEYGCQ